MSLDLGTSPIHRHDHDTNDPRSIGELFSDLSADASRLVRAEVQLAKVELKQEATKAAKASGLLGAAGVLGYLALMLLLFAAAWGLAEVMPAGLAFLIVGVVVAAVAAVVGLMGRKRMQQVGPPKQTTETIREDKQWLSEIK